jgi:hypothetical protein
MAKETKRQIMRFAPMILLILSILWAGVRCGVPPIPAPTPTLTPTPATVIEPSSTSTPTPASNPQVVVTTRAPMVTEITPTTTVVPLPIPTTPPAGSVLPCGFQWANRELPELDAQAEQALSALGIPDLTVRVFEFGEACAPWDGISPFAEIETDFDVTLPVADAHDLDQVGSTSFSIVQALSPLLSQGTGEHGSVIRLIIIGDPSVAQPLVRVEPSQVLDILAQNLTGSALMTYLGFVPQ